MKVYILYRPKSEHARKTEEYVHDFVHAQAARTITLVDVDSKEGSTMAELYDTVQYPAILAVDNGGQLLKSWQGDLPLTDELSYYTQNG
ncbi:MAG: hypothetical protein ACREGC_04020 [Minisyncoccia bacterium]